MFFLGGADSDNLGIPMILADPPQGRDLSSQNVPLPTVSECTPGLKPLLLDR